MKQYFSEFPDGVRIAWRPLTRGEYQDLIQTFGEPGQGAADWLLCEAAAALCVQGTELDSLFAGTVMTLGEHILEHTGFIPTVDLVQQALAAARERVLGDWYETAAAGISAVFHIPLEAMDDWSLDTFMDYVARAEAVTGKDLTPVSADDLEQEETTPRKYMTGPRGERIPLLSKADLAKRQAAIDLEREHAEYSRFEES